MGRVVRLFYLNDGSADFTSCHSPEQKYRSGTSTAINGMFCYGFFRCNLAGECSPLPPPPPPPSPRKKTDKLQPGVRLCSVAGFCNRVSWFCRYKFRPAPDNPYLHVPQGDSDDEMEMEEV